MKKVKLVPLLIAPLLLTSCDADLSVIKKPSFASLGQELSYVDFQNEVNKSLDKSDVFGNDLLKSKELSINSASAQSVIRTANKSMSRNDKKILSKRINANAVESTIKYDAKKLIALAKSTTNSLSIEKDSTIDTKEVADAKSESGLAVVSLDDGKSAVSFNNMTMTYSVSKAFGEGDDVASYVDMQVKMVCLMYLYMPFVSYLPADDATEEVMGNYHFYKNADIYTYTYKSEESVEIDESETLVARLYSYTEIKVQLELKENKQSLKYYYCDAFDTQYLNEYNGANPGDEDSEKVESAATISLRNKNVSLKKIDIAKYDMVD